MLDLRLGCFENSPQSKNPEKSTLVSALFVPCMQIQLIGLHKKLLETYYSPALVPSTKYSSLLFTQLFGPSVLHFLLPLHLGFLCPLYATYLDDGFNLDGIAQTLACSPRHSLLKVSWL